MAVTGSVEENDMNNTQIAEWNELDKLSVFKSLSDIRLASIPIIKVYMLPSPLYYSCTV